MSIIINSLRSLNLLWSLTVTSDETCLEQAIRVMSLPWVGNPSHIRHLQEVEGGRRAASCNVWPPRGPSSSPKSSLFHSTMLRPRPLATRSTRCVLILRNGPGLPGEMMQAVVGIPSPEAHEEHDSTLLLQ